MIPQNTTHIYAVILAGGSGTRLWPLSTHQTPKQFLSIGSDRSLIGLTADRLEGLLPPQNIWVVCGEGHALQMRRHLPAIAQNQILVEPEAKNTAAAIALAAIHLRARDPEALMIVLPADHLILPGDWEKFRDNLRLGAFIAKEKKALVTLGIQPSEPATGYGYLEVGERHEHDRQLYFDLRSFREKPDSKTASFYLEQKTYYWNSGIFLWEAQVFMDELDRCCPQTGQAFENLAAHLSASDFSQRLREIFKNLENISVDYAVMEKAKRVFMVPAKFSWDDVGSLTSFAKLLPADANENNFHGNVFFVEANKNLVISQSRPVALIGVEELVVVETPEAVLVMPKNRAQDVKKLVEELKKQEKKNLL